MRKILHDGSSRLEILEKNDTILKFRDIPPALDFLRRFGNEPAQMFVLPSVVAAYCLDADRLSTEDTIKQVASLLVSGELKILKSLPARGSRGEEPEEDQARRAGTGTLPPPGRSSWIEINLWDMEGQAVPGKRYRIKMPDGSVQEGTLDAFGHGEYYDINPGTRQVSFPELGAEAWEPVSGASG